MPIYRTTLVIFEKASPRYKRRVASRSGKGFIHGSQAFTHNELGDLVIKAQDEIFEGLKHSPVPVHSMNRKQAQIHRQNASIWPRLYLGQNAVILVTRQQKVQFAYDQLSPNAMSIDYIRKKRDLLGNRVGEHLAVFPWLDQAGELVVPLLPHYNGQFGEMNDYHTVYLEARTPNRKSLDNFVDSLKTVVSSTPLHHRTNIPALLYGPPA